MATVTVQIKDSSSNPTADKELEQRVDRVSDKLGKRFHGTLEIALIDEQCWTASQIEEWVSLYQNLGYKVKLADAEKMYSRRFMRKIREKDFKEPASWGTKILEMDPEKQAAMLECCAENSPYSRVYCDLQGDKSISTKQVVKSMAIVRKLGKHDNALPGRRSMFGRLRYTMRHAFQSSP